MPLVMRCRVKGEREVLEASWRGRLSAGRASGTSEGGRQLETLNF